MQTTISIASYFKPEHVIVDLKAGEARAAIEQLARPLMLSGIVGAEYAADAWQREQRYPTGLPTEPVAIAIPHADPDHAYASGICIGVLKEPVEFSQMGTDHSTRLPVQIIFLLAIKEQEKQVEMIQQLMTLIQSPRLLESLLAANSRQQVLDLIFRTLGEEAGK